MCYDNLPDDSTMKSLEPTEVGGNSTLNRIEEFRREYEKIKKELVDFEQTQRSDVLSICQSKSMPATCFFLFLSNLCFLFLGALENYYPVEIGLIGVYFGVISSLFIVAGWCRGNLERQWGWCDFSSLLHISVYFIGVLLLSIITALCIHKRLPIFVSSCSWWILLAHSVLSLLTFCVLALHIWWKIRKVKTEINEKITQQYLVRCKKLNQGVDEIKVTMKYANGNDLLSLR